MSDIMDKGRIAPITNNERALLIALVHSKKSIIESKDHGLKSIQKKQDTWQEITEGFNAVAQGPPRNEKQIRRIWERLKGKAKREHVVQKTEMIRIDREPPPREEHFETSGANGISNDFDSDAVRAGTSSDADDYSILVPEVQVVTTSDIVRPSSSCSMSSGPPDPLKLPSSSCSMPSGFLDPAIPPSSFSTAYAQMGPERPKKRIRGSKFDGDRLQCYKASLDLHRSEHNLTMKLRQAELEGAVQYRRACEEWGKTAVAMRESAQKSKSAYEEWSMAALSIREAAKYFVSMYQHMNKAMK